MLVAFALKINGAWVMGREKEAGSIEVGKYADFVVLDRNWFEIPPEDVAETRVLSTVFEGKPATHIKIIHLACLISLN